MYCSRQTKNNRTRIYDNSLTPAEPLTPDFKVSTHYYQVENENKLETEALGFKNFIETKIEGRVLGPVNAPIFRLKRKFRVRLLIRGIKSMKVQNSIAKIIPNYKFGAGIKLSVDVDPINFN